MDNIGIHVNIEDHESFINILNNLNVCQIMSGNTFTYRGPSQKRIKNICKVDKYIYDNDIHVYIHTILFANLCRRDNKGVKSVQRIIRDMEFGHKLGATGIVIHLGNRVDNMYLNTALDNMYLNVLEISKYASEECPLLIETTAGKGNSICYKASDLINFYGRFALEEQKYIKICVDTCHVHAAGYDPYVFVIKWLKYFPNSIQLIHFNDSKDIRGSRKDNHTEPGYGKIHIQSLRLLNNFCTQYKIDMVYKPSSSKNI
jgi:endonuclease IV